MVDMAGHETRTWGPLHEQFFHRNSNSMEISFCSPPHCSELITMEFCTWHDSCPVVPCAKFWSNTIPYNGVTPSPIFHKIWITMEKTFVKWALVPKGLIDKKSALIQVMAWHQTGNKPLPEPSSMTPHDITRPKWVNSLAPDRCIKLQEYLSFNENLCQQSLCIFYEIALGWMPIIS